MSKMLDKMNLISVVQQLPKEDIETIQGYVEMIEEENQELKLELSGYRQAILEDKNMLGLKEESEELKKQLKEYKRLGFKHLNDKCNKLENQQKEFIKWLEDYINLFDKKDIYEEGSCDMLEEILQKYKNIIGDDK